MRFSENKEALANVAYFSYKYEPTTGVNLTQQFVVDSLRDGESNQAVGRPISIHDRTGAEISLEQVQSIARTQFEWNYDKPRAEIPQSVKPDPPGKKSIIPVVVPAVVAPGVTLVLLAIPLIVIYTQARTLRRTVELSPSEVQEAQSSGMNMPVKLGESQAAQCALSFTCMCL